MRRKAAQALLGALLLAGAIGVAQQRKQQEIDLQAAIRKETVDGDLNGAIKQYSAIVSKYKTDRATTAMALVRMADCYRKMGDAESRKLYEQVVKEYADQKDAVVLARAGLGGGTQPRRQTNTLVWGGEGVDDEGTISPDGRYLSFTDWTTGDLAIRDLANGVNRILTRTGNPRSGSWKDFAEESAISRDGKHVAFSWYNNDTKRYDLRVANLTGEPQPRRLYDDPENEWLEPRDWSPDGKFIVVVIARKDGADRLGLVSVADGSLRVLRSGVWPGNMRVFFSPDGKHIGYDLPEHDSSQPRDLFVLAVESGQETPVAVRRGQDIMMGWSPNGKLLLFGSDRSGSLGLWAQSLDNGQPKGVAELLKPDVGSVEPLGVTSTGALFYGVTSGGQESQLHIGSLDFASGKIAHLRDTSQDYPESSSWPYWSPDGKLFAYASRRGTVKRGVSVIVIRSTESNSIVRELPNRVKWLRGWAPDGQSLLGIGLHKGQYGALRIDVQTGAITPLLTETPGEMRIETAVWSPDGKSLYYRKLSIAAQESIIFRRDLSSGVDRELIRGSGLANLNLSPDGKYIATPSLDRASNTRAVLLIPVDGGAPRDLMRIPSGTNVAGLSTGQGQTVSSPLWAPDSKSLLIRKSNGPIDTTHEYWLVQLSGGAPRKVETPVGRYRWLYPLHPDGKQVLYIDAQPQASRIAQIWALENFLPAPK